MAATVNVNGRVSDQEHAVISVFDHGFLYGEGVYETLRTYNGQPFPLRSAHAAAAQLVRHARAARAAERRRDRRAVPRHDARRGPGRRTGPRGVHPHSHHARRRRAVVRSGRLPHALGRRDRQAARRSRRARCSRRASPWRSWPSCGTIPGSVNPLIKSNNLLNNALAMQEAFRRGAYEGVMRNYRGELAECTQSNLFVVKNGAALTPTIESGLLPGITREFLFEVGADGASACATPCSATRISSAPTKRFSPARRARSCRSCRWTIGRLDRGGPAR